MHDDGVQAVLDVLADLPPLGRWVTDAACRGQGDRFTTYPAGAITADRIEATCRGCPVRAACLAYGDEHDVSGSVGW